MFIAETVFCLRNVAAVRLAHAVRSLTSREEFCSSLSLWWTSEGTKQLNFVHSDTSRLSAIDLAGQEWTKLRLIQFLCVPEEEEWATEARWSVPPAEEANEVTPSQAEDVASLPPDSSSRLSTIPEGSAESNEDESEIVGWSALCEVFGIEHAGESEPTIQEIYAALDSEVCQSRPQLSDLTDLKQHVLSRGMCADIPTWHEASMSQLDAEPEATTRAYLASADVDPSSFTALDADEQGAYVAIEAYGSDCKLFEGLSRMPNADEHVELRVYEAHSRKVVIERSDDLLTPEEVTANAAAVTQAILDELKTWQGYRCFKRRPRSEAPCVIDTRWVYKWKHVRGARVIRARLCLRGFKEFGADGESNFAATATRLSQRAIVSECSLRDWCIASSDVPKAFLQGVSYEGLAASTNKPIRDVSFELAGEGLKCLQLLPEFQGFNPAKEVLHCLKPGTGCRDAPKCFSLKLRQATQEFGFVSSIIDPELELLFDTNRTLFMAILKHVDDLKMIGPRHRIIKFVEHLSKVFGKLDINWSDFTFCGVHHLQEEDGTIHLDQIKFLAACKTIAVPSAVGRTDGELNEVEQRLFLSLLMTVAYGLLTRPDLAVFISALQRESHKAKIIHVKRLNTLLKWAQSNPRRLSYAKMKYPDTLLQVSDASFKARAEDGLSVRGLISLRVSSEAVREGLRESTCHVLDFVSKAQRHVTRSTFSSELFAATDAVDCGLLHSVLLHELSKGPITAETARGLIEGTTESAVKLDLVMDAKSVTSAVTAPNLKIPAEPSVMLHVMWLRELIRCGRLKLYWCDTRAMIADGLTKGAIDRLLIHAAMGGRLVVPIPYLPQELP